MTGAIPNPQAALAGIASREADRLRREQLARLAKRRSADGPARDPDAVQINAVDAVQATERPDEVQDGATEAGHEDHDVHAGAYDRSGRPSSAPSKLDLSA